MAIARPISAQPWPTMDIWVWWEPGDEGDELWVCLEEEADATKVAVELPHNLNKVEHTLIAAQRASKAATTPLQIPVWVWIEDSEEEDPPVWLATEKQAGCPSLLLNPPTDPGTLGRLMSACEHALIRGTGKPTAAEALAHVRFERAARARMSSKPKGSRAASRSKKQPAGSARKPTARGKAVKPAALLGRARPFANRASNRIHIVSGGAPGLGRKR